MTIKYPLSALEMGRLIKSGDLDPRDLVEQALSLAGQSRSVFISISSDRARMEADLSHRRRSSGLRRSILDGVPMAWKDLIDVEGTVTTAGTQVLAQRPPAAMDAPAVANAAAAGQVSLGKTNMTELAYSSMGMNPHYGTPHATPGPGLPRVPGGSSSGSAVAVALGIVPAAMGSDTAGSLRIPAAFNGLYTYRPSQVRHSLKGVMPLAPTLDTIGVIARTLADCVAVDDCMTRSQPQYQHRLLHGPTCVFDEDLFANETLDEAVRLNMARYLEALSAQGVRVLRKPVTALRDTLKLIREYGWLGGYEAHHQHRELLASYPESLFDPRVYRRLKSVTGCKVEHVDHLYRQRRSLMSQLSEELEDAFLIMPTVAHVAPEMECLEQDPDRFAEVNRATLRYTLFGSLLDTPALAVPTGVDANGQYTSVQWLAPQGSDQRLISSALALHDPSAC